MTGSGKPRIERLAIVDDAEFDQMLYERIVRRSGLVGEYLAFRNAEEALEYLSSPEAREIDVILLDINMPGMSGFEFLEDATERFGDDFAKIVVVMLTTSLAEKDIQRAQSFKVVKDYAAKPLTEEELNTIASMLEGSRNRISSRFAA